MVELTYQGLVHQFEEYYDFEFIDDNPRHLYCVTYDSGNHSWYGIMRTSKYIDSGFDHEERYLSEEELQYCINMIPDHDREIISLGDDMSYEEFAEFVHNVV